MGAARDDEDGEDAADAANEARAKAVGERDDLQHTKDSTTHGAEDFESRIAALPISAAMPLRRRAKKADGSHEGGDAERASSHASSSAISGWLKGVAESERDGGSEGQEKDGAEGEQEEEASERVDKEPKVV